MFIHGRVWFYIVEMNLVNGRETYDRQIGSFPQVRGKHKNIPSRKLTYPTLGSSENHLQTLFLMGYVSSLDGI